MQTYERTETQQKIIAGLKKVHKQLIKFKVKNSGLIVVMKENKIVKIKPS
jgi:hypothetical protein